VGPLFLFSASAGLAWLEALICLALDSPWEVNRPTLPNQGEGWATHGKLNFFRVPWRALAVAAANVL